jgi:hypothetical protein
VADPQADSDGSTPRWVKVAAIVAAVVVVLIAVVIVTGRHEPSRHGTSGGAAPGAHAR